MNATETRAVCGTILAAAVSALAAHGAFDVRDFGERDDEELRRGRLRRPSLPEDEDGHAAAPFECPRGELPG